MNIHNLPPLARTGLHIAIVIGSVGLCLLLLPTRFPGMEILGVGPSWLVMWTVAWSVRRSLWHAATAGIVLGLIQDAMTFPATTALGTVPTHVLSLTVVGVIAFWLQKRRYLSDTIVSVSLATVLLTIVSEVVTGAQYLLQAAIEQSLAASLASLDYMWTDRAIVISISAILSGLWMPIFYYPLQLWWQKIFAATKLT
ncbi:rod shape-determining protein MreD [Chamaesiphon minutus]|uniref:Rod shape-determining protein MreD n=1 Tax=Chamaesiphon minutus (strain ATCC 27169 / PCC 6605) TaxID=1173020 RepID=K9UNJ2_CHAP6|nr:rod shape-determining protein MreD [Chamaesiphon minutus]AFY96006.1 rod shape-determining protein MreD [Chamaesiphon minutus PCC 6605]